MNKIFIASITKIEGGEYQLTMLEFGKNGFNRSHELDFKFDVKSNLNWEIEQIRHYLEYENGSIAVMTNDTELWNKVAPCNIAVNLI
jgi:hypothetical protein